MDDRDAAIARVGGRSEGDGIAVEHDFAGCRLDHAGENLHQRRLAGAILSEQRGDLAAMDVEIDALERVNAAVRLGDIARREHDVVAGAGIRLLLARDASSLHRQLHRGDEPALRIDQLEAPSR